MSSFTIEPDKFTINSLENSLGLYQFDTKIAKHYFCKVCGIYPFHQSSIKPDYFRINLGCVDELDVDGIPVDLFDGKNSLYGPKKK